MKESDWTIFKQIKDKAIQKFCQRALNEFEQVIKDEKEDAYNRYLLLYKLVQNQDKRMQVLFDYHSRSKALIQLIGIRGEELADESLLSKLSAEFLEATEPKQHGW